MILLWRTPSVDGNTYRQIDFHLQILQRIELKRASSIDEDSSKETKQRGLEMDHDKAKGWHWFTGWIFIKDIVPDGSPRTPIGGSPAADPDLNKDIEEVEAGEKN